MIWWGIIRCEEDSCYKERFSCHERTFFINQRSFSFQLHLSSAPIDNATPVPQVCNTYTKTIKALELKDMWCHLPLPTIIFGAGGQPHMSTKDDRLFSCPSTKDYTTIICHQTLSPQLRETSSKFSKLIFIGIANIDLGRYDAARNFTENQEVNYLCPFQKLCAES